MSKSKILDETDPLEIDKYKSKNGTSVSEALALFNCNSGEQLRQHHTCLQNKKEQN